MKPLIVWIVAPVIERDADFAVLVDADRREKLVSAVALWVVVDAPYERSRPSVSAILRFVEDDVPVAEPIVCEHDVDLPEERACSIVAHRHARKAVDPKCVARIVLRMAELAKERRAFVWAE